MTRSQSWLGRSLKIIFLNRLNYNYRLPAMSMMIKLVKGLTALMGLLVLIFIPARCDISIPQEVMRRYPESKLAGSLYIRVSVFPGNGTAKEAYYVHSPLHGVWLCNAAIKPDQRPRRTSSPRLDPGRGIDFEAAVSRSVTIN